MSIIIIHQTNLIKGNLIKLKIKINMKMIMITMIRKKEIMKLKRMITIQK